MLIHVYHFSKNSLGNNLNKHTFSASTNAIILLRKIKLLSITAHSI